RADRAITHEKQVLAARLGYQTLGVEENRLVVPIEQRLPLRENRVYVVTTGLALGHLGVHEVAREGRDLGANPPLDALFAQVLTPRVGNYRDADRVVAGIEPHDSVAHKDEGSDVALGQVIRPERLEDRCFELHLVERDFHEVDMSRVEQSPHVLPEPENGGASVL